jgi:hypothetical protein
MKCVTLFFLASFWFTALLAAWPVAIVLMVALIYLRPARSPPPCSHSETSRSVRKRSG